MATPAEIQHQAELNARHTDLTAFAAKHLCLECGGPLEVRWWQGDYEMACGQNKAHIGTKSCWDAPAANERRAKEMAVDKGMALEPYMGRTALTQDEAGHLLLKLWPDAPSTEVYKASLICWEYGLNPLMRHMYLVKYDRYENKVKVGEDWSIQIGIGATRMIARRSGAYSYEDNTPRIMTEAEQVTILGGVDEDRYWAITKIRDMHHNMAQGYGNWPKETRVKGDNKGNTPQNMAFIRSERAALDKLFPEKLPKGEVAATEYMDAPVLADHKREQITNGKAPQAEAEQQAPPGAVPELTGTKETTPPAVTGPLPVPAVQNWGEMATAIANMGISTNAVLVRGGVKRWQDLTDSYGLEGGFKKAWELALGLKKEKKA